MRRLMEWLLIFIVISCLIAPSGVAAEPLSVFVSIAPQKTFVQQIGKELVEVHVLVPPGADPHTYEPLPQQMVALSKARLYFAVGVEFEAARLPKIAGANPHLTIVPTDRAIAKLPMAVHSHAHRQGIKALGHGKAEATGHAGSPHAPDHREGLDPHIWLDPTLVKVQAGAITAALQQADPAHRDHYAANAKGFLAAVDALDAELKAVFAGRQGQRFMVFHPSWGYLARAYGLEQVPIEIEGKAPKPAQLQTLIEQARKQSITVIFVQPQFSAKSAELVAREIGGRVVVADPLAEDWFANLKAVARAFEAAAR